MRRTNPPTREEIHVTRSARRGQGLRRGVAITAVIVLGLAAACGGDDDSGGGSSSEAELAEGVDDGSTITMWTRAATAPQSRRLVNQYNATHENQVELSVFPTDAYLGPVGPLLQQGPLPRGRARPRAAAHNPGGVRGPRSPSRRAGRRRPRHVLRRQLRLLHVFHLVAEHMGR